MSSGGSGVLRERILLERRRVAGLAEVGSVEVDGLLLEVDILTLLHQG